MGASPDWRAGEKTGWERFEVPSTRAARPGSAPASRIGTAHNLAMARLHAWLPPHPVRNALQSAGRCMSLQNMRDKQTESFHHMFGRVVGKREPSKSVSIRKLLKSTFEPERPVIRSISSDFCEEGSVDLNDETLVHWKARSGETLELAKLLMKGGGDARNKRGETPLHIACFVGNVECAELLLQAGADVNSADSDQWTPLHWAVEQNHHDVVRCLLTQKAHVNLALPSGKTALDLAVQADSDALSMLQALVQQEQDRTVQQKAAKTVGRALSKFTRNACSHGPIGSNKPPTLDSTLHKPRWRHLEVARLEAKGRIKPVRMQSLLHDAIRSKDFALTAQVEALMSRGHAAMVRFLCQCSRPHVVPVPFLMHMHLPTHSPAQTHSRMHLQVFFLRSCGATTREEAQRKERTIKMAHAHLLANNASFRNDKKQISDAPLRILMG